MAELESLPNIGPKLAADLRTIGVPDVATLRSLGAAEAARRLEEAGLRDCTHSWRALEGALSSVRWTTGRPAWPDGRKAGLNGRAAHRA